MNHQPDITPVQSVTPLIRVVRDMRVMLDSDLAKLYGVQTFRLNEAVKRNRERFPEDFLFRLTAKERGSLYPADGARQASGDKYIAAGVSAMRQAEEWIPSARRDRDDLDRAIAVDAAPIAVPMPVESEDEM